MADKVIALLREHGVLAEPVEDADLVIAREVARDWAEKVTPHMVDGFMAGQHDDWPGTQTALAAIKRVRAEGAGG